MCKIICLFVIIGLVSVTAVLGQQTKSFYGFGSVNIPTEKDEEYSFKWARAGICVTNKWLQVIYEYDLIQSDGKYAYARIFKNFLGGETSILAGKFLSPVPYLYPGPKTVQTPRWAESLDKFSICATGLSVWHKRNHFILRLAHYGKNMMSATVSVHSLSAFYEKNIGYGLAMESPVKSWWFNPWVGYAVYNDDREVISIQNYFQLPYNLRLYILMDTGDRMPNKNGDRPSDGSPLVGGTWEFAENFFVKIYYEGKSKKALIELTFAFANTK